MRQRASAMGAGAALLCSLLGGSILFADQDRPSADGGLVTLPVKGQVSLVSDGTTNALVQVGTQGVLVVDTLTEGRSDALLASIRQLAGSKPVRYIVNTQADGDHVGGNVKIASAGSQLVGGNFAGQLGAAGAASAFIVAHEGTLHRVSGVVGTATLPFAGWPTNTFFQDEKVMYFNGEGIELVHEAAAHTDGDILVFFRSSDVIAAGDIYATEGFPRIDLARGGNVSGVIEGLNRLVDLAISEINSQGGTRIVPGHGRISDEMDVVEYRDMVTIVRDRVAEMLKRGMTPDQVRGARPAFDWEPRYGAGSAEGSTAAFVDAVIRSVAGTSAPQGTSGGNGRSN